MFKSKQQVKSVKFVFKNFLYFLRKNLNLIFSSVFKSLKTYVYVFIIPLVLLLALFTYQTYGGLNQPLPPIVAGYLLIPAFSLVLLITSLINEWKASIFLKRIHTIGTSKNQFLLSIWIVGYFLGLISIIFCGTLATLLASSINPYNPNVFIQLFNFLSYGNAGQIASSWVGVIAGASIVILASIGISTLISGIFKNTAISHSLGILLVVVTFILSDLLLSPDVLANSKTAIIFSYFVPQKYGVWAVFYAASSGNLDYFLPNPGSKSNYISFLSIKWPLINGFLYVIGLFLLSLITFKWNNRG